MEQSHNQVWKYFVTNFLRAHAMRPYKLRANYFQASLPWTFVHNQLWKYLLPVACCLLPVAYFQARRQEGKAYYLFEDTMAKILIISLYYCIALYKENLIFVTFDE